MKEKIKKIIVSSIFITMMCHALCCILPMIGFIVGLNVVGLVMHKYENVYIVLNIIAIISGFYITYIHNKKKKCDHNSCHKTNSHMFWIASGISILMMILTYINK